MSANRAEATALDGSSANGVNEANGQLGQPQRAKLDPRVRRTRKLLQEALLALLAEKRFEAITVQDITERATLNRATFYAHFADKYALVEYCVREAFTEALADHLPADATLNVENLHQLIVIVCHFVVQLYDHCAPSALLSQFIQMVEAQIQEQLHDVLLAWLAATTLSSGRDASPNPKLVATVASWAIYGVAQQWARGNRSLEAEQWARQALPLVLAPIRVSLHSAG